MNAADELRDLCLQEQDGPLVSLCRWRQAGRGSPELLRADKDAFSPPPPHREQQRQQRRRQQSRHPPRHLLLIVWWVARTGGGRGQPPPTNPAPRATSGGVAMED